jgi:hypothetical protein
MKYKYTAWAKYPGLNVIAGDTPNYQWLKY